MGTDSDATSPIRQILRCSRLLREGWHGKSELARRLAVSERTVKRYLRAIAAEDDGFEVREVDERGLRKYRLRTQRVVDRRRGSSFEIMALAMAQVFFEAFDPGGVADLLDQVLFEITGEEEESEEDAIDRSRRSMARRFVLTRSMQPLPGRVRRVFDQVLRGLVQCRVVDIRYRARHGQEKVYVLRPYTLLLGERELAVTGPIGEPPEDGSASAGDAMRTFALHRIIDIELRMTKFRMPNLSQWDPKSLYARAWGLYSGPPERVRVEVQPAFAEVVAERRWHESQQLGEPAEDGWLSMQFDVFTGGEFRTWLLGWGPWLRVVEPAHLNRWIHDLAATSPGEHAPDEDEVFRIV
jgi:predicted DNA-binding transcriptional regulator YafY